MPESVAGPIQRVRHPGLASKDPEEGKLISFQTILMEKGGRHSRRRGLQWSSSSRGHRWKEMVSIHQHMQHTLPSDVMKL